MGAQYVSFDDVKSSCSSLSTLAGDFGTTIDNITSSLSNFDSAWKGDAASNFKSEFENFASKAEDAKKQIALSVLFLASVADGYDALGKDAVNKLKELIGGQSAIDSFNVDSAKEVDLNARLDENGELKTSDSTSNGIEDPSSSSNSNNSSSNNSSYSPSSSGVTYTNYSNTSSSSALSNLVSTSSKTTAATIGALTNLSTSALKGETIEIPDSVTQGPYTVTGYDYWISSGKEMIWSSGTNQRKVSELWKKQGSKFKNGIAVITVENDDGEDEERYLIAVSPTYGQVGDCVDVKLEDGTIIPCIIADAKSTADSNYTKYGHQFTDGSINILEFEVERATYLEKGNPTTSKWDLEWDSTKDVESITNKGSIINATAKSLDKTVTI